MSKSATKGGSARSTRVRRPSVLLVSVPGFAHGWAPLNIARLKAYVRACGYDVRNLPLCVEFSEYLAQKYPALVSLDREVAECGHCWHELYFAALLFDHASPRSLVERSVRDMHCNRDVYQTRFEPPAAGNGRLNSDQIASDVRRILHYCTLMREYFEYRMSQEDLAKTDIVGFSCMDAQFLTSVYLCRRMRESGAGDATVVFGGPMFQQYNIGSLTACFPELQHVVVGDGEEALLRIVRAVEGERRPPRILSPSSPKSIADTCKRLDTYPPPDYDDLIEHGIREFSLTSYVGKGCPFWRCSFCPISERALHLRPPEIIFKELRYLINRYGTTQVCFGDWTINGSAKHLEALCDLLIKDGIELDGWAEINARNTSPTMFRKMKKAGLANVQIGIESFSARVLKRIGKPATVLDNVKVLKWGIEASMHCLSFNVLCNHPFTTREDVVENLRVMRLISHLLRPPVETILNEMELYRTSQMFQNANDYRISGIKNFKFFDRCYPEDVLKRPIPAFALAFRGLSVHPLWKKIDRFLKMVRKRRPKLRMRQLKHTVMIYDSRGAANRRYNLNGTDEVVLYQTLDRIASCASITETLSLPERRVKSALRRLVHLGLVLESKQRYFGLPLRE